MDAGYGSDARSATHRRTCFRQFTASATPLIETQLDAALFFRVHRSTIVNIDRVREIHPLFRGDCALVLENGQRLKLSRSRRKDFEVRFRK